MAKKYAEGLSGGQYVGLLKADFKGLENLDKVVNRTLYALMISDYNKSQAKKYGVSFEAYKAESLQEKGGLAAMIRQRVGRALAVVANKAKAQVPANKSNLQHAVGYGVFKTKLGGSVSILDTGKGRKESVKRVWSPGLIKPRTVSERTRQINEYYGRDRAFILRILNSGTDVRTAHADVHGRGSKATWGGRGSIAGRDFFHTMRSDMERAAEELGYDIRQFCETLLQQEFTSLD